MAKGDEESASQQQLISHAQLNWQWEMEKTTLTHPAGSKKKKRNKIQSVANAWPKVNVYFIYIILFRSFAFFYYYYETSVG